MSGEIPPLDLSPEIEALWDDLQQAISSVIKSGRFIMGPEVKELEQEVAAYLGVKHAIAVNSGTDALVIAMRALGVGPGDEVITTPFTFFATAESASIIGAVPVFVDIDPVSFNIDTARIAERITPKTKAIIPVHLYGHAADLDAIMHLAERHKLKVLEDVAQAFGGRYKERPLGGIGHAGALSFFPSKNLGAFGDAGMITTNDDAVAETARMLRTHGSRKKYFNEMAGYNSRMDTLQAAILKVKLPHLDRANDGRRRVAARYTEQFSKMKGIVPPSAADYARHVYHQYTVRILDSRRDAVQAKLGEAGIGTMIYYPVPLHKLPIYADRPCSLPQSEQMCREVLSLPIWPQMTDETQDRIVQAVRDALG